MGDLGEYINQNDSIAVARNRPLALIVGAGGFLGSHLTEEILAKGVQVIGVDNFSTGDRKYLLEASRDKKFHLLEEDAGYLSLDVPRLDYVFIVSGGGWRVEKLLSIIRQYKPKVAFVSSIELYDRGHSEILDWFKQTEAKLARLATEDQINTRVVRLTDLYGPRMHFKGHEPVSKLIRSALLGELHQEMAVLDFSTRALFITDAVSLVIKSMLSGSTALKIYDGALIHPIKVSEVKQVLLDPLWYEHKGFQPSELPPWPTPNLLKTSRELNWKPGVGLVEGLRKTVGYFKDHEISLRKAEVDLPKKAERVIDNEQPKVKPEETRKVEWGKRIGDLFRRYSGPFLVLFLIGYALIFPAVSLTYGVVMFGSNLSRALVDLGEGQFESSLASLERAEDGLRQSEEFIASFAVLEKVTYFEPAFLTAKKLLIISGLISQASKHTVVGIEALNEGSKAVTGGRVEEPSSFFEAARIELAKADEKFSKALVLMQDEGFITSLPPLLQGRVKLLEGRVLSYAGLTGKGRVLAQVLPDIVGTSGKKSYLVAIVANSQIRPSGGVITSLIRVDFEDGKLTQVEASDDYDIDSKLGFNADPPQYIRTDLAKNSWEIGDAAFDPDYPTSAKSIDWFYQKATGVPSSGVISLDLDGLRHLLSALGGVQVPGFGESVDDENVVIKTTGFLSSEAKERELNRDRFITVLGKEILNKLFFTSLVNWPKIASSLDKALQQKHMMIFFNDPKMFTRAASLNWAGVMPRGGLSRQGEVDDFLAVFESNMGANQANLSLERSYALDSSVKEEKLTHRLKVVYKLKDNGLGEGEGYVNRLMLYLPLGSSVTRVLWDDREIKTSDMDTFSDYGRIVNSFLIKLAPGGQKTLVVDYTSLKKANFDNGGPYRLNVLKQPGTGPDPFEWTYKDGFSQPNTTMTDLSQDLILEANLAK